MNEIFGPFDLIDCFCPPGGIVLDPFNGSGTTCVAAKSLNRKYVGIDCSQEYCDIAKERVSTEIIERKINPVTENESSGYYDMGEYVPMEEVETSTE